MKKLLQHKFLLIPLSTIICGLVYIGWFLFVPPSQTSSSKIVMIKRGTSLQSISALLEEEGIIHSKRGFMAMVTLLGKGKEIKAGEYEFFSPLRPLEVLNLLAKGQVKKHLVTIPEGFTMIQIAYLLEILNIVEKESFIRKATSPEFIESLGLFSCKEMEKGPTLEGFLFPDTYHLLKEMDPAEVIQIMIRKFQKVYTPELMQRTAELGMTQREVVILASIIEKETSLPEERPLISAVFHNRLKKGMPLQSDPTVIYGIKNFDGNLRREHLETSSPYNTYLLSGLPPTPICNPGKDSLIAALYPASVPYLYFVSKNDGSHYFSSDLEDHQRAVWKYQKAQRRNP